MKNAKKVMYKRMAIRESMGYFYSKIRIIGCVDPFTLPFRNYVKEQIKLDNVDIDELLKYMISDGYSWALYLATTMFAPKKELQSMEYCSAIVDVFSPEGKKSKIIKKPEGAGFTSFVMDIENAREELGYEPEYTYIKYLEDYKKEQELKRFDELWKK